MESSSVQRVSTLSLTASMIRFIPLLLFFTASASHSFAVEPAPYYGVFRELPVSDITPTGWLAEFLCRQRDGMALNRKASGYPFDTDLWNGKLPDGRWKDYEQTAYLLDGTYRCGLLLKDKPLTDLGLASINYVLEHPEADGTLGPTAKDFNRVLSPDEADGPTSTGGQWPFAVFTRALMAHYSVTGDPRVLNALTRHYLALPENFGLAPRDVMNVEGMCWLYSVTGDKRILDLAERTWENMLKGKKSNARGQYNLSILAGGPLMRGHGVTVSEQTKLPALLYMATGKKEYLDAGSGAFNALHRDHELVDGALSSDAVLSGKDPSHAHETCVIVDYTWSLGYLFMAGGDPRWADTVERAVFNAGFGVVDREFKSHQYYGVPNQMTATQTSSRPSNGNRSRPWQAYRPDHLPACCTGNLQRMIPDFASRLWLSDGKGGLVAALYAPNTVQTKAGAEGVPVTIQERTDYPFDGAIEFKITLGKPALFPLYLRIPGWAEGAAVSVNGESVPDELKAGSMVKLERVFKDGDTIKLNLPMKVRQEFPVANGMSILRGPLLYALKLKEDAKRIDATLAKDSAFPAWDITTASPWNYSLAFADLEKVKVDARPVKGFPWTQDTVPVKLLVLARKVPAWVATPENENPPLPKPPFELANETEEVELIPYGATQLRIAVFPDLSSASSSKAAVTAPAATAPAATGVSSMKIGSYTGSVPPSKAHADTEPPSVLTDGKWANASKQSLQYGKDVVITAKLQTPAQVNEAVVYFYHFLTSMVDSVGVEISADGTSWESIANQKVTFSALDGSGAPACELSIPVKREAAYVRFTVRKTAESARVLLGEIAVR